MFYKNEISFYEIDFDYIKNLYQIDQAVYYHPSYKEGIKPYVGIILFFTGIHYFIPLTSAKPKHSSSKWRMNSRDYLFIYDKVSKEANEKTAIYREYPNESNLKYHILGLLDIRKMIPVPEGKFHKIDFKSLNLNYQFLFYKEHEFCKSHQDKIIQNASRIYHKTKDKGRKLSPFHCDYPLLERSMAKFQC